HRAAAARGHRQPGAADGRDRGHGERAPRAECRALDPVPDRRRARGERADAAQVPLPGPPAPERAAEPAPPARGRAKRPDAPREPWLRRGRDAGLEPVDTRGRARLSRSEPRAARIVLRAAAVAAALQADPDGRRDGPLLSDRPLLPG